MKNFPDAKRKYSRCGINTKKQCSRSPNCASGPRARSTIYLERFGISCCDVFRDVLVLSTPPP